MRDSLTITLPAGTKAFSFYAEATGGSRFTVRATEQDGTAPGPIAVHGGGGAATCGFYATGSATIRFVTVRSADAGALTVGAFQIHVEP